MSARMYGGDGRNVVGKLALAVLAVVVPFHYRVDGGKPFHRGSHRALRCGAADGSDCVLHASTNDHPRAGERFNPQKGSRARLEGQTIAAAVCFGNRCSVTFCVDRAKHLRRRRIDLADPRSAHQERAARQSLLINQNPQTDVTNQSAVLSLASARDDGLEMPQ